MSNFNNLNLPVDLLNQKNVDESSNNLHDDLNNDTDIMVFLEEIMKDNSNPNDSIATEETNSDMITGAMEVDDALFNNKSIIDQLIDESNDQSPTNTYNREEILSCLRTVPEQQAKGGEETKPQKQPIIITFPPEPIGDIDPSITSGDMMSIIYAEILRKKIAGHHLDSMNSFNKVGIKQIATKLFVVEGRMKNQRDKTDEDKEIAEIMFKVEFTDINLTPPTTVKYKSGSVQMLTPNMARLKNLTYSAQMFINAKITATAIYKNGTTKIRTAGFENHRIASIPCEVGTELCNTYNCSKATLKALEEDPSNPGGYFIIKGTEWTIDNLENLTNNTFHVYKNAHLNEIARGTFLSKPGDAFENSYQVILRYLNSGAITIEITTSKFDKFEIPYYLIFRALGMTRDRDIINHIVYGVDNDDPVTKSMLEILSRAFDADDATFGAVKKSTSPTEIIQYIATRITETAKTAAAKKDDNIAKYLNNNILNIIDRFIFPHIGTGVEHRTKKLRFFGHLINKLLCVYMEVIEPTDRDSYKNKRVFAAGTSMAKAFKTDFNIVIVQEVRKHLAKDFKSTPFSQVQLVESVKMAINSDDLERMLTQAITTGNKTITIKRNEITNRISSQTLYHKNDLNVKSTLNTINTSNTTASKQNERADEMRRVHPTYLGYIDISQSSDTGEKVGMSKQMACTASVCGASSSYILKRIIQDDPELLDLDNVPPEQITAEKLAKIFVNGEWIGCCKKSHEIARKYRTARRFEQIHHLTTIVWEPLLREVHFWTDVGRLMRPLVIVYNNIDEYIKNWRHGDKTTKFKQWIKLTRDHIRKLQTRKMTMDDLRRERVIEYISPEEQENTFLAPNITTLREFQNDLRRMYTHCDIDQAIFGIITLAVPMANHSLAIRNTMYTNHRKQSAGWFALNYPYRIDKNTTLQHFCERPIIGAFSDSLTYPNGQNTIVALALHGGYNCEDSIDVNRSSIDCGAFNASFYNYERCELEKGEQFGNPDYARTMDIKKDAIYEYVKNGFITEGTVAKKGYVLIVKAAKIPKPVDQYLYIDKSIVYKRDAPVYVERVIVTRNDEDALIAKVKLRSHRPLIVGDKLACLTPEHDVLTTRGWLPISSVTLNDTIATLRNGKYLSYEYPSKLHRYDHDGDIYVVNSCQIHLRTTLNHRMFVSKTPGGEYNFETAGDIIGETRYYKSDALWDGREISTFICPGNDITTSKYSMDDWLVFLGLWFAYGYLDSTLPDCIIFTYSNNVLDICTRMGLSYESFDGEIRIRSKPLYLALIEYRKDCIPEYVWNLCQRQARILLNSLTFNDTILKKIVFTYDYVDNSLENNHHDGIHSIHLFDDITRLILHSGWNFNQTMFDWGTEITILINMNECIPSVNSGMIVQDRIEHYSGPVYCLSVPSEVFLVRAGGKICWSGNSRHGNKGIAAKMRLRVDMPYCEDGLTPDLIVNAHSIPTRMAVNQIIECLLGQLAARKGCFIDATAFREQDIDSAVAELEKFGVKYGGHRRMYNGRTGDWIDTLIFIGPTCYQRLQKFVIDEHYATRTGPTSATTRQPLDGKNNDGGLRMGEMEKDVFCAHGTMRALFEKFYKDSDGITLPICRICGNRAVVNEKMGIYKCKYCGDNADIVNVGSSWVANLFFQESSAMNVAMRMELAPFTYSKLED